MIHISSARDVNDMWFVSIAAAIPTDSVDENLVAINGASRAAFSRKSPESFLLSSCDELLRGS